MFFSYLLPTGPLVPRTAWKSLVNRWNIFEIFLISKSSTMFLENILIPSKSSQFFGNIPDPFQELPIFFWNIPDPQQELPSHSPLIPLYSLSSAAGETRFLPQRGNNQTSTTRSSQSGNHFIKEELFIVKRHFSINSGLVDWFSTKFPATIVKIFHFCQVSSFRRTPVFQ